MERVTIKKLNHRIFLAMVFLLVAGCTGLSAERFLANKQTYMMSQGFPPAYVVGYVDGCSAGRRLAGDTNFVFRKNNTRFDRDALYARGWQEGQINCRNEAQEEIIRAKAAGKRGVSSIDVDLDCPTPRPVPCIDPKVQAQRIEAQKMWDEIKK